MDRDRRTKPGSAGSSGFDAVEKAAAKLAPKARTLPRTPDGAPDGGAVADLTRAYNDVFWDSGSEMSPTPQICLVVEPSDGRMPPFTAMENPADVPEERPAMERGIAPASRRALSAPRSG